MRALESQGKYGVFGNDALTLLLMQRYRIKPIATTDEDFKDINEVKVVDEEWFEKE